jgi:hypothetical protein
VCPTRRLTLLDLTTPTVYFMGSASFNTFRFDLKNVDFEEGAPVLHINPMDPDLAGEVSQKFVPVGT